MGMAKVSVYQFKAIKINKHSSIFESVEPIRNNTFLTKLVKVEAFQNYSHAKNLHGYFVIRTGNKWDKSGRITGLMPSPRKNHFFGNRWEQNTRTLLIFNLNESWDKLAVYVYQKGYYPGFTIIQGLISGL